jgi:hypothetical protein
MVPGTLIYSTTVQREKEIGENEIFFWHGAKVRGLTNPTVCSCRPAEILRKKAQFQLPCQLGPNMKDKEKLTKDSKGRQGQRAFAVLVTFEVFE